MSDSSGLIARARHLFAGRFEGVLSTLTGDGHPFGSVVPYSLDRGGRPLLLISHLAEHTRNLDRDPRCALTLLEPGAGDVQERLRLCLTARAERLDAPADEIAGRHFRYFPAARDYFEALNFRFHRLVPVRAHVVGGFGAARWLGADRLIGPSPFSASEEDAIVGHMNRDHRDALHTYLAAAEGAGETGDLWMAGIDGLGIDLLRDGRPVRVPLARPVASRHEARAVLVDMAASAVR
ncbi:MAG: DUF2470 domain-containing protein [Chromatiales bacterium]|jgi:putative heme iron utilization protein